MAKEILYIYLRVSTEEQKEKDLSLPRQQELGISKAKELGMSYQLFSEGGESASQEGFENRPKFFELLKLVQEGVAKHVFVFDQTRLSRNTITKAVISESLRKQGVQLYTYSKRFDFNKQEDVLTFKILEAIEAYESALRKARFQLGYVSANKKGRFLKGIPPYGYKKDEAGFLVVDEEEKKVFLQIVNLYLTGSGTNQIAKYLNDRNIQTKTSKILKKGYTLKGNVSNRKNSKHVSSNTWNPGTINEMLKHELYVGKRKFKVGKTEYETVSCEALIDQHTFDKIQTRRTANAITKKKEDKYFYLLKDIIQCGNCGQSLHGRVKPDRGEYTYRCNSKRITNSKCNSRGINIDKLNAVVWNAFTASSFYHKQINARILNQLDDSGTLEKRLNELETEFRKLEKQEKKILERKKAALKHSLDKRLTEALNEILDDIQKDADLIADNKLTCLTNIKQVNESIQNKSLAKSKIAEGMNSFNKAVREFNAIQPPFETIDVQTKARQVIKEAIQNVKVIYIPEKRQHRVEVSFHKVGIKKNFNDTEPYKYKVLPKQTKSVSVKQKVDFSTPGLPDNIRLLNDDPAFAKAHKNLAANGKNKRVDKIILPLLIVQHHSPYDAANGKVFGK